MKEERGVTLTSLCIYIISLTIAIGLLSTFASYFMKNTNDVIVKSNSGEEYARFLTYFTKDVNSDNLSSVQLYNSGRGITFEFLDGKIHQYVLKNGKMYYVEPSGTEIAKQIVLCTQITLNETPFKLENSNKITASFLINNNVFSNVFYILN